VIRLRLVAILGAVLLLAAAVLLCGSLGDEFATSLPYQDPTPDLLHQQAVEMAAARHNTITRLWISGSLAIVGLTALVGSARALLKRSRATRPVPPVWWR
jgi:hypothetical protein